MKTVGPAMSLRTSCWLLPQNEQKSVFFASLPRPCSFQSPDKMQIIAVVTPQDKPGAGAIPLLEGRPSQLRFPSTESFIRHFTLTCHNGQTNTAGSFTSVTM